MPVFAYRGLAADGRSVNGVVDADSARTARGKLRASGIFPTDLNEEVQRRAARIAKREWLPVAVAAQDAGPDLALLTRQLSALLGAGVQLVDALGTLSDQSSRAATKRMLSQVRERVREGIVAGRRADRSSRGLLRPLHRDGARGRAGRARSKRCWIGWRTTASARSEFVTKVRGALTYPIIMMCVGIANHGRSW